MAGEKYKKRPKYGNKGFRDTEGIYWHSKGEHTRWCELRMLEKAGKIKDLKRQVTYTLEVKGVEHTFRREYVADYEYIKDGILVTEDFKSDVTEKLEVFRMKADLFYALYGRKIHIEKGKTNGRLNRDKAPKLPSKKSKQTKTG